jgi:hypothetical protein
MGLFLDMLALMDKEVFETKLRNKQVIVILVNLKP